MSAAVDSIIGGLYLFIDFSSSYKHSVELILDFATSLKNLLMINFVIVFLFNSEILLFIIHECEEVRWWDNDELYHVYGWGDVGVCW